MQVAEGEGPSVVGGVELVVEGVVEVQGLEDRVEKVPVEVEVHEVVNVKWETDEDQSQMRGLS